MAINPTQVPGMTKKHFGSGKFSPQWIMLYALLAVIAVTLGYIAYNQTRVNNVIQGNDSANNVGAGSLQMDYGQNGSAAQPAIDKGNGGPISDEQCTKNILLVQKQNPNWVLSLDAEANWWTGASGCSQAQFNRLKIAMAD